MIRAAFLTTISRRMAGKDETAKISEAIAAMENMEAMEARYRTTIAAKLKETREALRTELGLEGNEALVGELREAISKLESTQAKLDCGRESRQRRLRAARATQRALRA